MTGTAANPESQRERARDMRDDEQQAADDLRMVMATPGGRGTLWRLLESAGIFRTSFAGEAALTMAFNEGRRDVGQGLLAAIMAACPEQYAVAQNEAVGREKRRKLREQAERERIEQERDEQ